jgi:hypothetical protein
MSIDRNKNQACCGAKTKTELFYPAFLVLASWQFLLHTITHIVFFKNLSRA